MNGVIVYDITHGNEKSNFYIDRELLYIFILFPRKSGKIVLDTNYEILSDGNFS